MTSEPPIQAEERLAAACSLSLVGGLTDVYPYLGRGHVFANAVTGNMVLLGLDAATLGAILLKSVGRFSSRLAPTLLVVACALWIAIL